MPRRETGLGFRVSANTAGCPSKSVACLERLPRQTWVLNSVAKFVYCVQTVCTLRERERERESERERERERESERERWIERSGDISVCSANRFPSACLRISKKLYHSLQPPSSDVVVWLASIKWVLAVGLIVSSLWVHSSPMSFVFKFALNFLHVTSRKWNLTVHHFMFHTEAEIAIASDVKQAHAQLFIFEGPLVQLPSASSNLLRLLTTRFRG